VKAGGICNHAIYVKNESFKRRHLNAILRVSGGCVDLLDVDSKLKLE